MKPLLKILSFVWLACWLYMGINMFLDTPKHIDRHKEFVETQLMPSVKFVKTFKAEKHRLPTNMEFYLWVGNYYNEKVDYSPPDSSSMGTIQYLRKMNDVVMDDQYKFRKADWNKDFGIGVWNGDFWEYYFSWSDSYGTCNYSWSDGFIGLLMVAGIGFSPILLWWFIARRKKKHQSKSTVKNLKSKLIWSQHKEPK